MFAQVGVFGRILAPLGCILASSWAPLFGRGPPRCPGCRQDPPNQPSRHRFSMILGPISLQFSHFLCFFLCVCLFFWCCVRSFVCLSVCLSVCLFVCLFVCLLACLLACLLGVSYAHNQGPFRAILRKHRRPVCHTCRDTGQAPRATVTVEGVTVVA